MPMEFIGNIGNLFSPDYRYQAAFSFSNVLAVPLANVALLVVIILWAARRIHLKTVKQLNDVPQMREHFPFQFLWIVAKTCYQPNFTVGFSTLLFAAVSGLHVAFQRHGRFLMYIGFKPWLCVFKAEYVEEVLSSNKILTKGQEYGLLHSWLGTGLLTSSGEKWRSRRRLLTPSFHFRILEDFMPTINKESMILAKKLGQRSRENETLDVVPLIALCTLDIICETIMGSTISAQTNEHSPYVIAVKRIGELFVERVLKPILQIDFIYRWTPMGREYRRCLHTLHSFTRKLIAERKQTLRKEVDSGLISLEHDSSEVGRKKAWPFLDLLLLEHFKNNITEEGIREEVDTFMFEESQRIYPSVPLTTRTCMEPFTVGGTTLPKGSIIQIAPYFLHRDPAVFPKPEEFHPERFFPENSKGRHPYAYAPFSAGPRNCIGQRFALAEEKIAVANILRRFRVRSLDQRDQVALSLEMVLRPGTGLRIKFTPR
ncbi:cytochrome P450 4c3-like isoform X3 [Amblyomma americanum]